MKFKTNHKILSLIVAGTLLTASVPALALTGDTEQPIHIDSAQQSLDMQGNTVTFTGDVVVTQGTKLSSSVLTVLRVKKSLKVMVIP